VSDQANAVGQESSVRQKTAWRPYALLACLLLLSYIPNYEPLFNRGVSWLPQGLYSRDTVGLRLAAARMAHGLHPAFAQLPGGEQQGSLFARQVMFQRHDGRWVPRFPLSTALLATPFFIGPHKQGWLGLPQRELYAAAFLTVATCLVMLRLFRGHPELAGRPRLSFLLAAGFGLATPLFASNSQALWSHTGSALFITLFLCGIPNLKHDTPAKWVLTGGLLALAAACRPSHLVSIVIAGALMVGATVRSDGHERGQRRSEAILFAAGASAVLLLLACYNFWLYADPFGPYILQLLSLGAGTGESISQGSNGFATALAGTLVSPSFGLFFAAPIALLALAGARSVWMQGIWGQWMILTLVAQWLLMARNPWWWGGWCWSGRLWADLIPIIAVLCIEPARALAERGKTYLLIVLLLIGFWVQGLGVVGYRYGWFLTGEDPLEAPWRLWSLNESLVLSTWRQHDPPVPSMKIRLETGDFEISRSNGQRKLKLPLDGNGVAWSWSQGFAHAGQKQQHLQIAMIDGISGWFPVAPNERGQLRFAWPDSTPARVNAWMEDGTSRRLEPDSGTNWSASPVYAVGLGNPLWIEFRLPVPDITGPLETVPAVRVVPAPFFLIEP